MKREGSVQARAEKRLLNAGEEKIMPFSIVLPRLRGGPNTLKEYRGKKGKKLESTREV